MDLDTYPLGEKSIGFWGKPGSIACTSPYLSSAISCLLVELNLEHIFTKCLEKITVEAIVTSIARLCLVSAKS